MFPTLDALIKEIDATSPEPLDRLSRAAQLAADLNGLGDRLLTCYVDACRQAQHTWAEIGEHIGVSRQAAQQRFSDDAGAAPRTAVVRNPTEHRGKYRALWEWLRAQDEPEIPMTFKRIEEIVGMPLPPSSRAHQPHWHSYDGSAVARALIDAGYKASRVDFQAETLVLIRVAP